MKVPLSSETIHASCVAIGGRAVLLAGRSGSGKSDLAMRLIDRGAALVSDDYTLVRRVEGRLLASPPATIAGRIELRGIGLLTLPFTSDAPVALLIDLDRMPERLPEADERRTIAGVPLPVIGLAGLEPSAPIKVEQALALFGTRTRT
ncbi:MAG: HPr kinase/phosphorylase [Allosphingosinicella sp.]|uniref:HPr kinase/phosphorylase n=1 Tax=Allosphingosinicella sp. TaxID=2823234 RepID=UPI00394C76F9